jgi:hypothetical protein
MNRQKFADIFDALHERMPCITRWVGWGGLGLGLGVGFLHVLAMVVLYDGYGARASAAYAAAARTNDLLGAPLAQYVILLGFMFCLLWPVTWALRIALLVRHRVGSRWPGRAE